MRSARSELRRDLFSAGCYVRRVLTTCTPFCCYDIPCRVQFMEILFEKYPTYSKTPGDMPSHS